MSRPLTPMEAEAVDQWLRARRCCGSPQLCGASCMDDEETWTETLVVREMDRLREAAR
jgi:hypothetical protein